MRLIIVKTKKTSNLQLAKLKNAAMKLRANYQIPYVLWDLIRNLNVDSSLAYINSLKADAEDLIRVKGYYNKYPVKESIVNKELSLKYSWTRKD